MKEKIIIVLLLLALIYLYYQNRKGLPATTGTSETIFEINESLGRSSEILKDLEAESEELTAERDQAIRSKNEAEAEVSSLSNQLRNKQQEVTRKETEIERLKKEKNNSEISLNKKISEKNGLITTLQREINQQKEKYSKQGQLLDEEQLECKKLEEKVEKLESQIGELTRSKSPMPGEFPTEEDWSEVEKELTKTHQEQLRKINLLFDENAKNYENIDFNGLYELLKGIKEKEHQSVKQYQTWLRRIDALFDYQPRTITAIGDQKEQEEQNFFNNLYYFLSQLSKQKK